VSFWILDLRFLVLEKGRIDIRNRKSAIQNLKSKEMRPAGSCEQAGRKLQGRFGYHKGWLGKT